MKCDDCSKCCTFILIPLNDFKDEDYFRWIELHEGASIVEYRNKKYIRFDNKCSKLIDNKCSIYKDRPQTCKDFMCKDKKIGI